MSRKNPIEQLKSRVGEKISQFNVEHWTANGSQEIISVGLVFDKCQSFILGCAGNGSVFVRKGKLVSIPNETELRRDEKIIGSSLSSVIIEETKIEFVTSSDPFIVANVCDEIKIYYLKMIPDTTDNPV